MHGIDKLVKILETEQSLIGLRPDGIVHVYGKENAELDVDGYLKTLDMLDEITDKRKSFFIYETGEYFSMTREAHRKSKESRHRNLSMGTAIVIRNLAYRLLANFYYTTNKPDYPYKVVTDFNTGVRWLNEIRKESKQKDTAV